MGTRKVREPIPEQFGSYEEAAEFWDQHDTMDYPGAFRSVELEARLLKRRYELEIDPKLARLLRLQARRRHVSATTLANRLLRNALTGPREVG